LAGQFWRCWEFDCRVIAPTINGNTRDWVYFLVDEIYPEWSVFVNTFTNPIDPKKRSVAKKQEVARKVIECAFGILVQQFHVL
jgi:Plant transposon protein